MTQRPIGPSMPVNDLHNSLRPSPFDMDERIGPRVPHPMNHDSSEHRQENWTPDYFTMRPLGGAPSPPSFSSSGVEPEMMHLGQPKQHPEEFVRRTNLQVQFVNGLLSPVSRYGQPQPKMCSDSRFPVDFSTPRTIEEVRAMDPSAIDRILRAYNLPTDLRTLRLPVHNPVTPRMVRHAKLCTLYDFLGAVQLAERQRAKTPGLPF